MDVAKDIEIHPVDESRWPDLADLFGEAGGHDGCWCMFWRLPNKELMASSADENRERLRDLISRGGPVGLIAYLGGEPVGWCTVGPRTGYARVERTKAIAPADPADPAVWSVPCFFVRRDHRRTGVASTLVRAAVEYAREQGARMIEGYPVAHTKHSAAVLSTGTVGVFTDAGFAVGGDTPASGRRLVVRHDL
ncbi:N-acetyltransferase [Acrocarpospora phusangensis]|uniref:N-acetyltransferase n=1 Tax=Acrocarpospora phusangensis TaxID=1070424 RepID=A0A919UPE9_9ACTN|nr:GNAT family N-acetyltransferase [Acrocarpospora phusangensis]GIH28774.1 N-acetyltransferase [Acrocarpospora phusangensis]